MRPRSIHTLAVLGFAACLLPTAPSSAQEDVPSLDVAAIDAVVASRMDAEGTPGVAVAIVREGEVLLAKGYGLANLEHEVPVTAKTMFQSGSVGKMFTAAGVMVLVEDGDLDLDASIRTYLPEGPESWQPITLRHLLSHTSGIPDYTSDAMDYSRDYSESELVQMAASLELEFPAGTRWNYSNTGYVLLGIIIDRTARKPYWEHLRERVWDPAGVPTMRVNFAADVVLHRSAGYEREGQVLLNQAWVAPTLNSTADGSLLFSLEDMIAWNEAVRRGAVLSPASWEATLTPIELTSGNTFPYGFGWAVREVRDRPIHEHGGGWQGFRTHYTRYVDVDVAIVALANSADSDPGSLVEEIAVVIDPSLAHEPTPTEPIDDPDPEVTAFIAGMLEKAGGPGLELADFAFIRQTSFPWIRDMLKERLDGLGAPDRLELLQSRQVGDDTRLVYRAAYAERTLRVDAAIGPNGGLTRLRVGAMDG